MTIFFFSGFLKLHFFFFQGAFSKSAGASVSLWLLSHQWSFWGPGWRTCIPLERCEAPAATKGNSRSRSHTCHLKNYLKFDYLGNKDQGCTLIFHFWKSHFKSKKFLFCKTPYINSPYVNSPCRVYIMVSCQKEEKKTVLHRNLSLSLFFFSGILNVSDHKNFRLLFIIDLHCWVCYCFDFSSLKLGLKKKKNIEIRTINSSNNWQKGKLLMLFWKTHMKQSVIKWV